MQIQITQASNGSTTGPQDVTQLDNIRPHIGTETLTLSGATVQQTNAAPAGTRSVRIVARGSCWVAISSNPQPAVGSGYLIEGGTGDAWLPCAPGDEVGACADTGATGTVIVHWMG